MTFRNPFHPETQTRHEPAILSNGLVHPDPVPIRLDPTGSLPLSVTIPEAVDGLELEPGVLISIPSVSVLIASHVREGVRGLLLIDEEGGQSFHALGRNADEDKAHARALYDRAISREDRITELYDAARREAFQLDREVEGLRARLEAPRNVAEPLGCANRGGVELPDGCPEDPSPLASHICVETLMFNGEEVRGDHGQWHWVTSGGRPLGESAPALTPLEARVDALSGRVDGTLQRSTREATVARARLSLLWAVALSSWIALAVAIALTRST